MDFIDRDLFKKAHDNICMWLYKDKNLIPIIKKELRFFYLNSKALVSIAETIANGAFNIDLANDITKDGILTSYSRILIDNAKIKYDEIGEILKKIK